MTEPMLLMSAGVRFYERCCKTEKGEKGRTHQPHSAAQPEKGEKQPEIARPQQRHPRDVQVSRSMRCVVLVVPLLEQQRARTPLPRPTPRPFRTPLSAVKTPPRHWRINRRVRRVQRVLACCGVVVRMGVGLVFVHCGDGEVLISAGRRGRVRCGGGVWMDEWWADEGGAEEDGDAAT